MKDYYSHTKCINDLESVLATAHFYNFCWQPIEKRISKSKYFSLYNSDFTDPECYKTTTEVLKSIFSEHNVTDFTHNYVETSWMAMMYVFIIDKTRFNFETIFTYIGIQDAVNMFKIYHEMDLTHSYNRFKELYNNTSIIKTRMKALGLSNKDISQQTSISLSMVDALKNRRRNIKKLEVEKAVKLAKVLNIQIETLLNN